MSPRFTLGIEEEFQMVDRQTGQLSSHILTMLEKGAAQFGDKIKAEMLQSTVEIASDICPNILAARLGLQQTRTMLLKLAAQEGLSLISAGTHPSGSWIEQLATPDERYVELEEQLQDFCRSILIFGLHVHVGLGDTENRELAISLVNQLRSWLPQLLALCQALVAKLTWLYKRGLGRHIQPRYYVEENKWQAMRYGLDGEITDFVHGRSMPMRDAIGEMLDFVDDVLDDLGSRREINYLHMLLDDPGGTGADRQIAVYRQSGSVDAVIRYAKPLTMRRRERPVALRRAVWVAGKSSRRLTGKLAWAWPPTLSTHTVATAIASHKRSARAASSILL